MRWFWECLEVQAVGGGAQQQDLRVMAGLMEGASAVFLAFFAYWGRVAEGFPSARHVLEALFFKQGGLLIFLHSGKYSPCRVRSGQLKNLLDKKESRSRLCRKYHSSFFW